MDTTRHILVVDDDTELCDLLSGVLLKNGFRVSVAANGRAMARTLRAAQIDLIILDILMPGEDGLSLCRRLRADGTIPIIMLTARGSEVDRVVGLEMGADDYLVKPFGISELLARIRAVLRRSAMPRTVRYPVLDRSSSSRAGASTRPAANCAPLRVLWSTCAARNSSCYWRSWNVPGTF